MPRSKYTDKEPTGPLTKEALQEKYNIVIKDLPREYTADDKDKVNITLPCSHEKTVTAKSLVKSKPKCNVCSPPKKKETPVEIDFSPLENLIENQSKEEMAFILKALYKLHRKITIDVINNYENILE